MSRKSRRRDADAEETAGEGKRGRKGKRGAKGAPETAGRQLVVETQPEGVPFAVVVLFAALMSVPSVLQYLDSALAFDAMMVRIFAALAVAWLLSHLVYAVFESMRPPEVSAVLELPPEQAYQALAGTGDGVLTGAVIPPVTPAPAADDPFALDPLPPESDPPVPPDPVPPAALPGQEGEGDFVPGIVTEQRPA